MPATGRLPRRFPVGTRYVLEGVPAEKGQLRVISRLLVLPNGEQFDLTHDAREGIPPGAPAEPRPMRLSLHHRHRV